MLSNQEIWILILDFGFPNKMRNPKTDFEALKSFSKMDFNEGALIDEIHLGKGFCLVEIRFWISHFIGKSENFQDLKIEIPISQWKATLDSGFAVPSNLVVG